MKSIIKELWYGNISGEMMNGEAIAQEKELMEYIVRHRSSLLETLSDEQKEIFEKLDVCYAELNDTREGEIFSYAFSVGARLAIEVSKFEIE